MKKLLLVFLLFFLALPALADFYQVGGSGGGSGSGTVTNVSTTAALTGGPITTSGTLGLNLNNANTWTGQQTFTTAIPRINLNTGAIPTPQTGTTLQAVQANTTINRFELDSYGGGAHFSGVMYNGTQASPTTMISGTSLCSINGFGYNGTAIVGPAAGLRLFANDTWAAGDQGSYVDIATTPNGSVTLTQVVQFNNDGGICVPQTVTGGDKGAGTINATGLYVNGVAVGSSSGTVSSFSAGNLSPYFTSSVATPTSTPALTFTASTIAANTVLGNASGSPAIPSALTSAQQTSMMNLATTTLSGVVPALTDAQIAVGKTASNVQAVSLSGDATLADTGAVTLATVNSNVGSFTSANITVNAKGLVTAAANGSGGGSVSITSGNGNIVVSPSPITGTGTVTLSATPSVTSITAPVSVQTITTDTDGATITFNLATSNWHNVVLGGNRTLALSNATVGQQFTIQLTQPASGGPDTVTWFSGITWNGGGGAPILQTANNAVDTITFKCTGSGAYIGYPTLQTSYSNITATTATVTHQIAQGTAPTVAVGAGAGTGGSPGATIAGHDTDFAVTLTTGTTAATGVIFTTTFGTAYTSAPYVQITAGNANAAGLMTAVLSPYVTSTPTTMVLNSNTTGITAAGAVYIWFVHVSQ